MNMLNAMPRNSRGAAVGHEGDGQPLSKAHVQPPQRDAVDFGSGGILRLDSLVAFDGTYLRFPAGDEIDLRGLAKPNPYDHEVIDLKPEPPAESAE
jgi:hypothetical protein